MTTMTTTPYHDQETTLINQSPVRARTRRWRRTQRVTAIIAVLAVLLSTAAWLSLVLSDTTSRCFHRFNEWEGSPRSLRWKEHLPCSSVSMPSISPFESSSNNSGKEELSLKHIVFGIAGSSLLWKRRKDLVQLWWRPNAMRGHVWMDEKVSLEEKEDCLPPIMVSEDISRFRFTNPTGHPSGLRISRIVAESFRLGLPDVRWFILGDDDTVFNADNLVAVLSKYDPSEMVYIGSPSESHSANTYFSHSMAFGGGGIALSYPLAEALSTTQDECLQRYPNLYGSDDRLHACITELGIPLTREHGFHQWDIRGNAHGLLSSHPIAPFVSIHHVEAVDPIYPGLNSIDSLRLFTRAMSIEPKSFLQRSICYDHVRRVTFSISLGYVVQVFPNIVLPRDLERSEYTYSAWNKIQRQNEFDIDTRNPYKSLYKKPILFFLRDIEKEGNVSLSSYMRTKGKDNLKRKFICFTRLRHFCNLKYIQVSGYPLGKNWHLVPRRLCCKLNQTDGDILRLTVGQCEKGPFSL